jgi:hypothetical protein
MNKPLSGRVLLRALLPAVALAFFLVDAVRNPQRVFLSLGAALLAAAVLYSRLRMGRRR